MKLHSHRYFDATEPVKSIAYDLYEHIIDFPILSPHGHVEPQLLAENQPFPDPTELIIIPDHYIYRLIYSQGIPLESMGVPTRDGTPVESDHRKIWPIFAEHYYLFAGTPTGVWLDNTLYEVLGVEEKLNKRNAKKIYDEITEKLQSPEFLPQTLFGRFNIEVLTTTDATSDSLQYHRRIKDSGLSGQVLPCFRPDSVIDISQPEWKHEVDVLSHAAKMDITSFKCYLSALENRREFFKSLGAVSTDQGIQSPYTHELTSSEMEAIFQRALKGKATHEDTELFTAHMLMEMARMSVEDGLVMQIHPGAMRNHNCFIFNRFGIDKGCDIPLRTEYTRNLWELLNKFGNDSRFRFVVFTLDESTYSRELAPLVGHYPAMKLGAPWWFHDSIEGMIRFRQQVTETASIYNTVGFTDDIRAFNPRFFRKPF